MPLHKTTIVSIFLLLVTITCFSQEKNKEIILPQSIYLTTIEISNFNSKYSINKKLNLNAFKFLVLDLKTIEEGYFTIPFYSINNTPTEYIYDSYNKIFDNLQLQKSFFKVSDLYRVHEKNKK